MRKLDADFALTVAAWTQIHNGAFTNVARQDMADFQLLTRPHFLREQDQGTVRIDGNRVGLFGKTAAIFVSAGNKDGNGQHDAMVTAMTEMFDGTSDCGKHGVLLT
jgi:hypothetical protein